MRALGAWLLSLAIIGLVGTTLTAIAPGKYRKILSFAVGLLVILLVLQPLQTLTGFSLPNELARYETVLSDRLGAAQNSAEAGAVAMICAYTARACETALAELGIAAEVTLTLTPDGTQFQCAEIVYEGVINEEQRAEAATVITAQTGVAVGDQIHR